MIVRQEPFALRSRDARPVFIFSAGWRSGSTLLQRLITASGRVLVWGESGGALGSLEDSWERYRQMRGPGNQRYRHGFGGNGGEELIGFDAHHGKGVHKWIACMNPEEQHHLASLRTYLEALYAKPAEERGYERWGVKEVQVGVATACFLREIFPSACFVFLVRDPRAAILSIKRRNWIDRAGTKDPLAYFIRCWRRLAQEFTSVEFGKTLRYEDLVTDPTTLTELFSYLDLGQPPSNFLDQSRADWQPAHEGQLSWYERHRIRWGLKTEMQHFGYID